MGSCCVRVPTGGMEPGCLPELPPFHHCPFRTCTHCDGNCPDYPVYWLPAPPASSPRIGFTSVICFCCVGAATSLSQFRPRAPDVLASRFLLAARLRSCTSCWFICQTMARLNRAIFLFNRTLADEDSVIVYGNFHHGPWSFAGIIVKSVEMAGCPFSWLSNSGLLP